MMGEALAAEEDGCVTGYMCKIDFECELGCAKGGNRVYPSVADLRENRKCVDECGIVEVRVYCSRVIQESDFSGITGDAVQPPASTP